jgi:hypothetical protein
VFSQLFSMALDFLEKAGTLFMLFGGPDNGKYEVSE